MRWFKLIAEGDLQAQTPMAAAQQLADKDEADRLKRVKRNFLKKFKSLFGYTPRLGEPQTIKGHKYVFYVNGYAFLYESHESRGDSLFVLTTYGFQRLTSPGQFVKLADRLVHDDG